MEDIEEASLANLEIRDCARFTHTLRHWHATMLCHRTKYVLLVKSRLGHKRIDNALLYTQPIIFEGDGYHSAKAKTVEEASKLVEAGFECVREFNENKVFSKGK
ncbi:MAG: hypothetical protein ACETWE_07980 [Candidatus Bathyarchaeia archaeon]